MSAASAVPGIGDAFSAAKKGSKGLGIAAKVGKGAGKELAEKGGKELFERGSKELGEEITERCVNEGTERAVEKTAKEGAINGLKDCGTKLKCFTAGTKVSTVDGQKNIEDIKKGDYVLSKNPITGEVGYKKVLKTFVSSKEELIHVKVGETFIETTEGHPFWVVGYGFKYSHEIKVGDHVITAEGIEAEVTFVETVDVEPTKTYNFEVEDWHTYFVSDAKIWVHNSSGPCDGAVKEAAEKLGKSKNYIQDANQKWHRANGQFASNVEMGIDSPIKNVTSSHGNSLLDTRTNYGYALVDKDTNEILKFGESLTPNSRYTKGYLNDNNAKMIVMEQGNKAEIHDWQHKLNDYHKKRYGEFPPLNKGGW
ncbi:MAG: hypothetical protein K6G26_00505 [Lachnospiraceae bacterium]|nr:hypothetical protein [Lachnospiraceae bacterium]